MQAVQYVQAHDRLEAGTERRADAYPTLAPLVGTWINTNPDARGIVKLLLESQDHSLTVRAYGADEPEPHDWGQIQAETAYPAGIRPHECMGFVAHYDFDFMEAQLQGNMNLGLLIVASFNTFKDDSGRSSYFAREFFRKTQDQN